jgi:hypothetical protein
MKLREKTMSRYKEYYQKNSIKVREKRRERYCNEIDKERARWQTSWFFRFFKMDKCLLCDKTNFLEFHHLNYDNPFNVTVLCKSCHKLIHSNKIKLLNSIELSIKLKPIEPKVCNFCKAEKNIEIHHIDGNRKNNKLENLITVCRSCHFKLDDRINNIPKETIGVNYGYKNKKEEYELNRLSNGRWNKWS